MQYKEKRYKRCKYQKSNYLFEDDGLAEDNKFFQQTESTSLMREVPQIGGLARRRRTKDGRAGWY